MKTVRLSSLIIGICMITQWIFFLATGNVPELENAPVSISFHITIEIITAVLLIVLFFILKKPDTQKLHIAGYVQGMLGYTVINSAGYFAQSGDWIFLIMFAAILFLSVFNLALIIRNGRSLYEDLTTSHTV